MAATNESDNTTELYRINDVLSDLAAELGVPVNEQWEDTVLNDLVLSVEKAFREQRNSAVELTVTDYIRTKTAKTVEAIVRLVPGAWDATRGVHYNDLQEDVKVLGRQLRNRTKQKFALMFMTLHGLEAMTMEQDSALDFTQGMDAIVRVPDFSEYGEEDLIDFYNLLAHIGVISEDLRDEVLNDISGN